MDSNQHYEIMYEFLSKDYITSVDTLDEYILIGTFSQKIYLFDLTDTVSSAKLNLIKEIKLEFPVLSAKFLNIENSLKIIFCGCNTEIEKSSNTLFYFDVDKLKLKDETDESGYKIGLNFEDFISKFKIFQMKNFDKTQKDDYFLLCECEVKQKFILYSISSELNNEKEYILSFNILDSLNLYPLFYFKTEILEEKKLLIISASCKIDSKDPKETSKFDEENNNRENFDQEKEKTSFKNKFDNMILFFNLEEKNFENFISEIKSPLQQITNSICKLNDNGIIIGSLHGRIAIIEDIKIEKDSEGLNQIDFKKLTFKPNKKRFDNMDVFFPVLCLKKNKLKDLFACGGGDRAFYMWNPTKKKQIFKSREYENSISNLIFTDDGNYLIFTSSYSFEDKFSNLNLFYLFPNKNSESDMNEKNIDKQDLKGDKICVEDIDPKNKNNLYVYKLN